jgi:hypothetical protein
VDVGVNDGEDASE